MRFYKVKAYNIGHNSKTDTINYVDDVVVKRNSTIVEEVVTGNKIRIKTQDELKNLRHCMSTFNYVTSGYDLIVIKEDLNSKNIVKDREYSDYIDNFENSRINKVFNEMNHKQKIKIKK